MVKIKQTNSDGEEEEVEVMTQAEVDAKLASEKAALEEAHKGTVLEKDNALKTLAEEKAKLEADLLKVKTDGMKEDHPNFKVLKEALSKKDTEISEIKQTLQEDKKQRVQEEIDTKIKLAAKGNEDHEKKIKFHYETTLAALPENTPTEKKTKLEAALKLSSDGSSDGPGIFDSGAGAGGYGGGGGEGNGSTVEFTAKERALGAKLGLTAEDYKKYGSRVSKR